MVRVSQGTPRFRMMSAGIDRVDPSAFGCERSDNRVLHGLKFGPAIIASADTGLIGDHDYGNAPLVRGGDHFRSSRNNDNVVEPTQITGVFNDRAVAIQEQCGAARRWALQHLAPDTLRVQWVLGGLAGFKHCGLRLPSSVFLSTMKSC